MTDLAGEFDSLWKILSTQLFSAWNLLLMFMVWMVIHTITDRLFPEFFSPKPSGKFLHKLPHRFKSVYAIWGCLIAYIFIPGPWVDPEYPLAHRFLLGFLVGTVTSRGHFLLMRLLPHVPNKGLREFLVAVLNPNPVNGKLAECEKEKVEK